MRNSCETLGLYGGAVLLQNISKSYNTQSVQNESNDTMLTVEGTNHIIISMSRD